MNIKDFDNPVFLKSKSDKELLFLASEIRKEIIEKTSIYGGHLSSNLGVVELTMGLHQAFDFSTDQLLFDVSHQTYTHKILTGRSLVGLRTQGGVSGFSKRAESKYDHFEAGHSSTSLSTAYGMAIARDLNNEKHHIVAVIGDSSIASGMAFEGLNNIGHSKHKVIIILNDNEMSIGYPVGAISRFLKRVRFSPSYLKNKEAYRRMMFKTKLGFNIFRFTQNLKNTFFRYISPSNIFEQMGFGYIGPINGHSFPSIAKALKFAKKSGKSVIIHVKTIKGKGYSFAEQDTTGYWHGVTPFDISTGQPKAMHPELISWSHLYSDLLLQEMNSDSNIVLINPATVKGSGLDTVFQSFPNRCFDVGIAEQHSVTMAAGLALANKKPVLSIYSTFMQRAFDQLSHDIARQNLDLTVLIDRSGLIGADGDTHQGIYDESFLISVPNMVVTMASNASEAKALLKESFIQKLPFTIRFSRDFLPVSTKIESVEAPLGQMKLIHESTNKQTALVSLGPIIRIIEKKVKELKLNVSIFNALYQKPIDEKWILSLMDYKTILIHDAYATEFGFANFLKSKLIAKEFKGNIISVTIKDDFIKQATIKQQMESSGVDEDSIISLLTKQQ